ncbi:HNH endonuclease signature motif containing protein [Natronomonas pharaonis]|nr:HNH endonuclease signature motif containing protein [Natronomonas pharaonis]
MEYRDRCLKTKGEYCHSCGVRQNIQVHHIDGDHSNNGLDNLVPLCANCHSKVHSGEIDWPPSRYRKLEVELSEENYDAVSGAAGSLGTEPEWLINAIIDRFRSEGGLQQVSTERLRSYESSEPETETNGIESEHAAAVYDILEPDEWMTIGELYEKYCTEVSNPKSKKTAKRYILRLCENGMATKRGRAKGRKYKRVR